MGFYGPDDKLIGYINEYELNDILIKLKKEFVPGYYCLFKGGKINIIEGGKISSQPDGFFDLIENQLGELLGF